MKSFLEEVSEKIYTQYSNWLNLTCVVPSERAGVRLKHYLKENLINKNAFLPKIISIEKFIKELAQLESIDNVTLLFEFYKVYKDLTAIEDQDSFEVFLSWANTVIQDFNEIDRHLVDPEEIFSYINDIKRMESWDISNDEIQNSKTLSSYLKFTELLYQYYLALKEVLTSQKCGYQGLIYREAEKNTKTYLSKSNNEYCFIGFNALNKAEELIFQEFLESGKANIFWDSDAYYMNSGHEAGMFLRNYQQNWKYYKENDFESVESNFSKKKDIEFIGAPLDVTQVKSVTQIIKEKVDVANTAIVLAEESFLPVLLNSIPKSKSDVNITMGYSLQNTPLAGLFKSVFQLILNKHKYQKDAFYYKDVLSVLRHPYIVSATDKSSQGIVEKILKQNLIFIEKIDGLNSYSQLMSLFKPFESVEVFIENCIQLILFLKEEAGDLQVMYLEGYEKVFYQLLNLNSKYKYIEGLKVLYKVFQKVVTTESISFRGDAIEGLQLMGVLETRCLDFENVIMTSVNEGVLPTGGSEKSFIPFDIKRYFNMPTYLHKDAIFSYHFYRLLQRAKKVYLLYNTQGNDFGGGEKSRFLTQLQVRRKDVVNKLVVTEMSPLEQVQEKVVKSKDVLAKIQKYFDYGLSPTKLSTYVLDPIEFYKSVVLKVKETTQVEEEIAFNTLGSVVHDTLDELHQPFVGVELLVSDVEKMKTQVRGLSKKYFKVHFKDGDIRYGKNKLISEVAIQFTQNFLQYQLEELTAGRKIRIIDLEQEYVASFKTPSGNTFKLRGRLDRVDEVDGVRRIVDYKTGLVKLSDLKLVDPNLVREDYKYSKALQVMIYALMYKQSSNYTQDFIGGIYSFRNFKEGFLPVNFSEKRGGKEYTITDSKLEEFKEVLFMMIDEVLDESINFVENLDNPYK